ncbi:MAG: ABC transporter permease [Ekhidna sp.]
MKERYQEQIEGDLYELFERDGSTRYAAWRFGFNTLKFFRLRYLKGIDDYEQLTTLAMVKNYLKVAIRTLLKQKSFAGINIIGLAIGLASCLMIMMYVFHERSYDNFYPESENIYRVTNRGIGPYTPSLLAQTIREELPQISSSTMIGGMGEALFVIDDRKIMQEDGLWADQAFFEVFQVNFLQGDAATALAEPDNIVLTKSLAQKYFPNGSAMGQIIRIEDEPKKVTGVIEDTPKNTHIPFKFVLAMHNDPNGTYYWSGNNSFTYLKVNAPDQIAAADLGLAQLYEKYVAPELIQFSGHESFEALKADYPDRNFSFTLVPMKDIHLEHPRFSMGSPGDSDNVAMFSFIVIFILLIACINYINMATARSSVRMKEVGIRKALGSHRENLILQFLVESMLITLLAIILSLGISALLLDLFSELTARNFEWIDLFNVRNFLWLTVLFIIVGLVAGLYPAFVISGFSPLTALRGGKEKQGGKKGLRNGLVAFQFATSIFLIATTFVIYTQVKHMQSKDVGIATEEVLVISRGIELGDKYQTFKQQLEGIPAVQKVAKASHVPFMGIPDYTYNDPNDLQATYGLMNAFMEPGVDEVLDINILQGRFFDPNRVLDTMAIIVNQAVVKELGWDEPIGKELKRNEHLFKVIGVMEDFNFSSLKYSIRPMLFRYGHDGFEIGPYHQRYILVSVNTSDVLKTIESIEQVWNENVQTYPFSARFLNDVFNSQFDNERKFASVFTSFSLLAILIAFLGLFALTTFVLRKRFKEIAVRKVLGATVPSLLKMILKDFTKLVAIGGVIGVSVAFYWLQDWLNDYTYRIELSGWLLVLPILLILLLTWAVVSLKSYKAATSNPSAALKEE